MAGDIEAIESIIGITESLIGGGTTKSSSNTNASQTTQIDATAILEGESRDRLEISDEAIGKIISDILSGPQGLASIFAGEQNAGIYNSSVANLAAGDLVAQITGEIAKLRAERVQTQNQKQTQSQTTQVDATSHTKSREKKEGILDSIF